MARLPASVYYETSSIHLMSINFVFNKHLKILAPSRLLLEQLA